MARALRILEVLGSGEGAQPIAALSARLHLHSSTVHRLLQTLVAFGFAQQDLDTSRYRVGPRAFEVGNTFVNHTRLREITRPALRQLCAATGETANLAILERGEVIYIDQEESRNLMRMFTQLGRRVPAHCTGVGKVLIADLGRGELQTILRDRGLERYTPATITDPDRLLAELAQVRRQGYALDREEREIGVRCVAAPIHDHSGRVIAALSISVPAPRLTPEVLPERIETVRAAAAGISLALGWRSDAQAEPATRRGRA